MPNGGYPLQLLTPIAGTDLAIHVRATEVALWQQVPTCDAADTPPTFVSLAALTADQVGALAYHLLYWNGPVNADLRTALDLGRLPVRPQFHTRGCLYDY